MDEVVALKQTMKEKEVEANDRDLQLDFDGAIWTRSSLHHLQSLCMDL